MPTVPTARPETFHLFDPEAEVRIIQRRLPHWVQAEAVCFITWRTCDSMPKPVLDEWYEDRVRRLRAHAVDPKNPAWRTELKKLGPKVTQQTLDEIWNRWHDGLDAGHGACVLRQRALAEVVENSLRHFDGDRYELLDFVIMPNHVHLLAAFPDEDAMLAQCESWKHYTATQINRRLKQNGRFWQKDAFDHLVRNDDQLRYLREYIADNPRRARLRDGEFIHYSKDLPGFGLARCTVGASPHAGREVPHAERGVYGKCPPSAVDSASEARTLP